MSGKNQYYSHGHANVLALYPPTTAGTAILSGPFFLLTSLAEVHHEDFYIWNSLWNFMAFRLIQMFLQETLISLINSNS